MFDVVSVAKKSTSSIVTLLIGLFIFVSIPSQIDVPDSGSISTVTARTLPYLITSAIILLSLLIIASNVISSTKEANEQSEKTSYGRVFLAFVGVALWIILLPYIGFTVATMLLVASIMMIIGNCSWWQIILLSLILSVPINYLLALVLGVYLPGGSLFGL